MTYLPAARRAALALTLCLCAGAAHAQFTVFEANGALASNIQTSVDAFRAALGGLNTTPGVFPGGRREINWDAVPDTFADPNAFPGDFFSQTSGAAGRQRGAQFTTPGTGFLVSADSDNPTVTPSHYGFSGNFQAFSQERLFAPVGSTITSVSFFIPGTNTPAQVRGFGAVFTDVELAEISRIDVFDALDNLLFSRDVLAGDNNSLSFLGILADSASIARVQIVSGDQNLLSNGNFDAGTDAVVMDDFIYGEPQAAGTAAPEPGALGLVALGGVAGLVLRRRRKG